MATNEGWTTQKAHAKATELFSEFDDSHKEKVEIREGIIKKAKKKTFSPKEWEKARTTGPVKYMRGIVNSKGFRWVVMGTIMMNVVTIAVEPVSDDYTPVVYVYLDLIFIAIYIIEFLCKVYVEPLRYWKSNYNKFDFLVILISVLELAIVIQTQINVSSLRILRSIRALRAFRSISFFRRLQVVFHALVDTLKNNAIHILVLLFLIMFIFGVLGHYLFGVSSPPDVMADWGTLPSSMYSLWVFVTAVGWLPYQVRLLDAGYSGSQLFTAVFMFFGNFIIGNLFIGVICENMELATETDRLNEAKKREKFQREKKRLFLKKQKRDMMLMLTQVCYFSYIDWGKARGLY